MKLTGRIQRESNPWCQSEAAVDFALYNRYPCQQGEALPGMVVGTNHTMSVTAKKISPL